MKQKNYAIAITAIAIISFYLSIGFFVIQPLGAIPEGITIMYFRFGMKTPFITSPDGILIDNGQGISLFGRIAALGSFAEIIKERRILNMPYSRAMYLLSTGGKEFEK